MGKKTIEDVTWTGKRALVRVDFNVPLQRDTLEISDDMRIRESLPTLRYLREQGAAIVLGTHLGRPNGQPVPGLELGAIAKRLSDILEAPVRYVHDATGEVAREQAMALKSGEVLLLENLRFYPGEEANDAAFARGLAALGDVFVNDAFGTAHRAHASTEGVAHHLPAVAGMLIDRELRMLGGALDSPRRPLSAVLGGAKVSDKTKVLEHLLGKADAVFIGGGMAATFLKAKGLEVGGSLLEEDRVSFCSAIMERAQREGRQLHLPADLVVAERLEPGAPSKVVAADQVPSGWAIADIGPASAGAFASELRKSGTIVWNGPMGVFEVPPFDQGTRVVAEALAESDAVTVIGGGSTAEVAGQLGLADRMSHVSTGGGASLEFLEGRALPGVVALEDK